jgi:protein-S-isoprenylcysteine O-methyltransferase Ste14
MSEPVAARAAAEGGGGAPQVAGVVAPPPLVYLAGLAAGFGLEALLPSAAVPDGVRWVAGGVLLAAGGTLMASFARALRRARTPIDPREPTRAIVTDWPFRLTRNPAYVAMALLYTGIALLAGALWALAPLAAVLVVIHRGVVLREERYLARTFGEEYLAYQRQVRRWL